jgi:hypothetical protein
MKQVEASSFRSVKRFAAGLKRDNDEVHAGLPLISSNGQVEGFVNKLKLLKRQAMAAPVSRFCLSACSMRSRAFILLSFPLERRKTSSQCFTKAVYEPRNFVIYRTGFSVFSLYAITQISAWHPHPYVGVSRS